MKKRIITGIMMAVILLPILLIEALFPLFQIVLFALMIIASIEMINMHEKKKKFPLIVKILIIISTIMIYANVIILEPACSSSIIVAMYEKLGFNNLNLTATLTVSAVLIFACQVFIHDFDANDVGSALLSILYVALGFSALSILVFNGLRFIAYLLIVCLLTDIFALVFGLKFGQTGKHRLAPHISPKKSWEGAIGGTVVGTLAGSLFAIFYDKFGHFFVENAESIKFFEGVYDVNAIPGWATVIILIVLSFTISVFSQIGDLVASKFKRTYEIKDFSQVFPGHGGVLDRFDSAIFGGMILLIFISFVRAAMPLIPMLP